MKEPKEDNYESISAFGKLPFQIHNYVDSHVLSVQRLLSVPAGIRVWKPSTFNYMCFSSLWCWKVWGRGRASAGRLILLWHLMSARAALLPGAPEHVCSRNTTDTKSLHVLFIGGQHHGRPSPTLPWCISLVTKMVSLIEKWNRNQQM